MVHNIYKLFLTAIMHIKRFKLNSVEVPACEEHRPDARQMLNQVEGSIKAIQEISELPFFTRWEAYELKNPKCQ